MYVCMCVCACVRWCVCACTYICIRSTEQVESMLRELSSDTSQQLGALRDEISGMQSKLDKQV